MKKILLISHLNIWTMGTKRGGPALWRTLNGYAKAGWKVFFITGNAGDDSIYEVHPNIQIIRFDLKWLRKLFSIKCIEKVSGLIWWPYFQIKSYLLCRKIAEKEKIDVFCGYESYGVPVAKLLAKKFHKPLISRFQGTGMGVYLNKRIWRAKFWKQILAMKIPTDLIIMTNDGTQGNRVLKKLKACSKETKFWVNGVDTDLFDPEFDKDEFKKSHGIKPDDKILLALSRLVGWKKVDRIILAMEKVAQQYSNVKLLIGGDGVQKQRLEGLARELNISDYVTFLGALLHSDVKNYLNVADIFISMYDLSNVGNPLLEAMRCGKCIITHDVGDTCDFVQNGQNGILLKTSELENLSDVILELLKNDQKRKQLGKSAFEFADKNLWTWEERIEEEVKVITELVDSQRNN